MSQNTMRAVPGFMKNWVPFSIAIISFVVSMYTFFITTREPVVDLVLPQQIRVSVNWSRAEPFSVALFQPTFVHAGPSQQVEVIESMALTLYPTATPTDTHTIEWKETGRLFTDSTTQVITYEWLADPAPLLLSRESAQSPLAVFYGADGLVWWPGEWRAEIRATRAEGDPDLVARFTFTVSQENFDLLRGGTPTYVNLPIAPQR